MKAAIFAFCALFSVGVIASEAGGDEGHVGEEGHHKHTLAVFAGITREDSDNHATLGLEYSYRISESWSVGGLVERAERKKESTLVMAFAHFWPYRGLYLGAGVGRKNPGDKRENTLRATIGYEFELSGGWVLSPQANLDMIEHEDSEVVFGIAFGKQF